MYYFKEEIEKKNIIPKIEQELTIPYEFKKNTNSRECIPRSILEAKNSYLG